MNTHPSLKSPLNFEKTVPPESVGLSSEGIERLVTLFHQQIEQGLHPGAQLVVLRHGNVVVDLAEGLMNLRHRMPVMPTTPFLTFSVSKPFTAACIFRLIDKGKVEWDAPIATYWPEFGCKGKEKATIRQILVHQAGIPGADSVRHVLRQIPLWPDWNRITRHVANLSAEYPPGFQTAYHQLNFGFVLGEVVRRVNGKPIETYLKETFLQPMGLQFTSFGMLPQLVFTSARLYPRHPQERMAAYLFNMNFVRSAVMPAATLHSTARELSIFFQMLLNGGQYAGVRYLEPKTIEAATELGYEGYDPALEHDIRWAYGFELGGLPPKDERPGSGMGKGSTLQTFGHFGKSTCMVWADRKAQLVVAFTCNGLLYDVDNTHRWKALSDAVWEAIVE
ncbi:MAG: serine hydrolase domain-containing protein [Chloroflexota bacterium]